MESTRSVDLNEFLSHAPNTAWPHICNRRIAYGMSLGDDVHALADVNRAVELGPGVNHFRLFRAQIFAHERKITKRAKAEYAESDPDPVRTRRSTSHTSVGENSSCMCFVSSMRRSPTSPRPFASNRNMAETKDVSGLRNEGPLCLSRARRDRRERSRRLRGSHADRASADVMGSRLPRVRLQLFAKGYGMRARSPTSTRKRSGYPI